MKYNINCIYNYYDTLLSEWGEWNRNILVGIFSNDAANLSEALGISTSDGRSRAKEFFRVGLLTHELTKGMEALNSVKDGSNLQSKLGFVSTLIFQGYEKKQTTSLFNAVAALNAIYAIIQPFEIGNLSVSTITVVHRLLQTFPIPDNADRNKWLRYLISGFCCELKVAEDGNNILDFITGKTNNITLRILDNKTNSCRASFSNSTELQKAIEDKVSLTNIHHQKMALFLLGSPKDIEPRGFYGLADKYFRPFLEECYNIEIANIYDSPFKNLYIDDEKGDCKKGEVLETIKEISKIYSSFSNSYNTVMKSIEDGAIEALMYMTDKPKSAFVNNWRPKDEDITDDTTLDCILALRTKPFLLLAGISGTGKSQKVQELAFMSCPDGALRNEDSTTPGNYCLIEVKPNWHDSSELLGYYSALFGKYELTNFIRFTYKAIVNPTIPFFLCLDEMNLAPVEQYFAEFLSVLETRKRTNNGIETQPLLTKEKFSNCELSTLVASHKYGYTVDGDSTEDKALYSDSDAEIIRYLKANGLHLPHNLFVIGTVNMDDTTHQFSRKVIDRAFTIEMNGGKMNYMFSPQSKRLLEYRTNPLPLDAFRSEFVRAYEVLDDERFSKYADVIASRIPALLGNSDGTADPESINGILNNTPFRVSYRVQNELVLYLSVLIQNAGFPDNIDNLIGEATLAILLEKILPRIQGEQKQLETNKGKSNILKDLQGFINKYFNQKKDEAENVSLSPTFTKVERKLVEMDDKLNGYYTNFF